MASISKREWIQWKPDGPSEPTDTIVLTSPQHRFVDIRVIKDPPNTQQPAGIRLFSQLDWAFAGTSTSSWRDGPNGERLTHSHWSHWVDSRHPNAEDVLDEGDMVPTLGDKVLERGRMVNPATGVMTDYEECWLDVTPIPTSKDRGKPKVAVLVMQNDQEEERGMVIRVGQLCQGVVRTGEAFALERWMWAGDDGWKRIVRMGDVWLPCGVAMEVDKLTKGGHVTYKEHEWRVVELA